MTNKYISYINTYTHFFYNFLRHCDYRTFFARQLHNDTSRHPITHLYLSAYVCVKDAPSSLRHFLAAESPLKMMKNAFNFTSKVPFVLKIFKFLS